MADLFRMAGDAWKKADKALGGWLPGGGTASPITAASQRAQRAYDEQIRRRLAMRDAEPGTPGRFAGSGQIMSGLTAIANADANPLKVFLGDKREVSKVADFYKTNPDLQNQYDLNTNLFLRYLSGTGTEGLKVDPKVGEQIYSDVLEQEKKFTPDVRQDSLAKPGLAEWQKQRFAADTPVYYGGITETRRGRNFISLPHDEGERWQLRNSLGSFWSSRSPEGQDRLIDDDYDFMYAPVEKGGLDVKWNPNIGFAPEDFGRRLVRAGFGTPYKVRLNVKPTGEVTVRE